jgi:hypothetical protein
MSVIVDVGVVEEQLGALRKHDIPYLTYPGS